MLGWHFSNNMLVIFLRFIYNRYSKSDNANIYNKTTNRNEITNFVSGGSLMQVTPSTSKCQVNGSCSEIVCDITENEQIMIKTLLWLTVLLLLTFKIKYDCIHKFSTYLLIFCEIVPNKVIIVSLFFNYWEWKLLLRKTQENGCHHSFMFLTNYTVW